MSKTIKQKCKRIKTNQISNSIASHHNYIKFIDALKLAYIQNCTMEIPYEIKDGNFVNRGFFDLLDYMGDDDPVTVREVSETRLVLEIKHHGIGKIIEGYESVQRELRKELINDGQ